MKPLGRGTIVVGTIRNLLGGKISARDQFQAQSMQRMIVSHVVRGQRRGRLLIRRSN